MPQPGGIRVVFEREEAAMLDQLASQLAQLLDSHSSGALDPDPFFASLEVGGSDTLPVDPALARLFPNAYEGDSESSEFRRVTEQGLINRKLQDALFVTSELGLGPEGPTPDGVAASDASPDGAVIVEISPETLPTWVRTLTALRLAIAARIGLDEHDDREVLLHREETRGTVLVFDWLAAVLESLITVMHSEHASGEADEPPAN
ncbi:DUF2017 family protein [Leucobacter chromiireducens]|uniref:DUF2017 family protein n=1 Tax=Leucobacter chromiireducens TaxID=283877 RepID=UPI001F1503FB|nr:DUF2017 family protein [Leucobacter chromiireducens]